MVERKYYSLSIVYKLTERWYAIEFKRSEEHEGSSVVFLTKYQWQTLRRIEKAIMFPLDWKHYSKIAISPFRVVHDCGSAATHDSQEQILKTILGIMLVLGGEQQEYNFSISSFNNIVANMPDFGWELFEKSDNFTERK